jgi:hypothetical protein
VTFRLSAPDKLTGVLDKDDAGAGILVGVQAPDPPFSISMEPARAQSVIGVGPPLGLYRHAQYDHVSARGSGGLLRSVIRTGRRSALLWFRF